MLAKGLHTGWCKDCLDGVRADAAVDAALSLLGELLESSQERVEVADRKGRRGGGGRGSEGVAGNTTTDLFDPQPCHSGGWRQHQPTANIG